MRWRGNLGGNLMRLGHEMKVRLFSRAVAHSMLDPYTSATGTFRGAAR
jgi:hypothetical protein